MEELQVSEEEIKEDIIRSFHRTNVLHFLYPSSVEGHLGSFQILAIINIAAMNIVEHVSLLHVGAFSG